METRRTGTLDQKTGGVVDGDEMGEVDGKNQSIWRLSWERLHNALGGDERCRRVGERRVSAVRWAERLATFGKRPRTGAHWRWVELQSESTQL